MKSSGEARGVCASAFAAASTLRASPRRTTNRPDPLLARDATGANGVDDCNAAQTLRALR
jgi:hypothetical protein